jgi:hypothetical protein
VGPRAGLKDVEKRTFLTPLGLELQPLGRPDVASSYTDYAIPAPYLRQISVQFITKSILTPIHDNINSNNHSNFVQSFINGSTALCWTLAAFTLS